MRSVSYPYKLAVLKDRNGDTKKRWFVEFYVWDVAPAIMVRKMVYLASRYKTKNDRLKEGLHICDEINKRLKDGEVIDSSKICKGKNKEVIKANFSAMLFPEAMKLAYDVKVSNAKTDSSKDNYSTYYKMICAWIKFRGFEKLIVQNITPMFILEYFNWLSTTRSPFGNRTFNNYVDFTKGFFNVLATLKVIKENPVCIPRKIETEAGNYVFNDAEKKSLLLEMRAVDIKLFYFCSWIYYSLLRPDELTGLQAKHIRGDKLHVPGSNSKMYGSDYIVIVPALQEIIKELGLNSLHPDTYIFSKQSHRHEKIEFIHGNKPYNKKHFTKKHLIVAKNQFLNDRFTLYSWKDTGIVDLYKKTKDIHFTSKQARHHSIEYTEIYLRDYGAMLDFDKAGNTPKLPV